MTLSPTLQLAQYAASTSLAQIPAEVRERAKHVIGGHPAATVVHAAVAINEHDVDRMLALAQGIEELEDVNELADAFTSPRP
jgi:hypothetical protein